MSSPPFDATIELALQPSLRALAWLFWIHTAVLGLALFTLGSGWPLIGVVAAAAASWFWTRRHPVFGHGPRALARLTWRADGAWLVHDAAGAHEAELLGDSLVHHRLLVLNFRLKDGTRRTRALLGDETDADSLRRLRARLSLR